MRHHCRTAVRQLRSSARSGWGSRCFVARSERKCVPAISSWKLEKRTRARVVIGVSCCILIGYPKRWSRSTDLKRVERELIFEGCLCKALTDRMLMWFIGFQPSRSGSEKICFPGVRKGYWACLRKTMNMRGRAMMDMVALTGR